MNLRPSLLFGAVATATMTLPGLLLSEAQARTVLGHGAYWALLLTVGLFAWSLVRLVKASPEIVSGWRKPAWGPVAGILGTGLVLMVQQPFGFRSGAELQGVGVSMSMHLDRLAVAAVKGLNSGITFQVSGREFADAPLLHPLLLSLLHSLTGYRPENAFALNAALLFLLLALAWTFGQRLGGLWQGALLLGLLASQPLLARSATGAGPGLLVLVLSLATLHLASLALEAEGHHALLPLGLCGILLACATEAWAGSLTAIGLLAYLSWKRRPGAIPSMAILLPLLLLPAALRLNLAAPDGSGGAGLMGNIMAVFAGLFDISRESTQSLVYSVISLSALPFFLLRAKRTLQDQGAVPSADLVVTLFALGFCVDALLTLSGRGGFEGGRLATEFGLRLGLAMAITTASAACGLDPRRWAWRTLSAALGAGFFLVSLPAMARRAYSLDAHEGPELAWKRAFIASHPLVDVVILDRDPRIWTAHRVTAISIREVAAKKDAVLALLNNRQFRHIYVCQELEVDPRNGEWVLPPMDSLDLPNGLQLLQEVRITPLSRLRISRLLPPGEGTPGPPQVVRDLREAIPATAQDPLREAYLKRFLGYLP